VLLAVLHLKQCLQRRSQVTGQQSSGHPGAFVVLPVALLGGEAVVLTTQETTEATPLQGRGALYGAT
jgi:hypothetical protein